MNVAGLCCWIFFVLLAVLSILTPTADGADSVVAVGDGIVVTRDDVSRLREFTVARNFRTSEDQYLKAAIRLALFAAEAERLGLAEGNTESNDGREKVSRLMLLSKLYIKRLEDEYVVSDLVIESYFLAHPDEFGNNDAPNEAQREQIRDFILKTKRSDIAKQGYENLKEKYRIQIVAEDHNG